MAKVVINAVCTDVVINGIPFNALNLNLAKAVHDYLIQVLSEDQIIMTRNSSTVCPLDPTQTEAIANASDVQLVISVGVDNAVNAAEAEGMEVFYSGSSDIGIVFANSILAATSGLRSKWNIASRFNSAQPHNTYYMLTHINKPAILVMAGMMSNTNDFNILINYNFQKEFGFAVAQGISSYLGLGTIVQNPVNLPATPTPIETVPTTTKNYIPWIIGIGGLGLVGIIFLSTRRK